jgi:endonuclease III
VHGAGLPQPFSAASSHASEARVSTLSAQATRLSHADSPQACRYGRRIIPHPTTPTFNVCTFSASPILLFDRGTLPYDRRADKQNMVEQPGMAVVHVGDPMDVSDIPAVNRALKREYARHRAPIVDLIKVKTNSPFRILVATILSARTRDEMTAEVCERLFANVRKPADFRRYTVPQLEALIFPIGFFRTKARHLRELPDALDTHFGGRIPDTIDELCMLPGVGRKTANLVVAMAFDKPAICVDVHVHRISNRLGLVKTGTPLETEMALRETLPRRYWKTWNSFLVSFGQTLCFPRNPRCDRCPIYNPCSRVEVRTKWI